MIVLVGFMGAGKSTVGPALAARLGLPFVDSDEVVERSVGLAIADIFQQQGEAGFRELEARVIGAQLDGPEAVLALGGGAVTTEAVRDALRGHDVVLLDISLEDALARVGGDARRPMLQRPDLAEIFAARARFYAEVATVRVSVAGRSETEVVEAVASALETPDGPSLDRESPDAGK